MCHPDYSTSQICNQNNGSCTCKNTQTLFGRTCDYCGPNCKGKFFTPNFAFYHFQISCNQTFYFAVKQFLVVGGEGVKATEVLDFSNSNLTKPSFGVIPETRRYAVGAYLNDQPIICGGHDGDYRNAYDTCLTFDNSRWSQTHKLTTRRTWAASVLLNETTLWILGGVGDLDSTELINANEENGIPGKELPLAMRGMCAVKYSSEKIFVIGGYSNGNWLDSAWIFNPKNNFNYITGPSLKNSRGFHGCALMKNGQNYKIVVGGGWIGNDDLSSVEILDLSNDNNQWTQGK